MGAPLLGLPKSIYYIIIMLYLYFVIFYLVRSCEPLYMPPNAFFVSECSNVYSSVCRMECHEGYEAVGSVERKCVVNVHGGMVWSGKLLQCEG